MGRYGSGRAGDRLVAAGQQGRNIMASRREGLLAVITVLITLVLCLGTAEAVLRFLPVWSGIFAMPVTAESPIFHFRPDHDFVFSKGWSMALANRGHINNAGFVNDNDYRTDDPTPLIAVVGDSYIEAFMVPFRETVQGRLATALAGRFRVYSFAASGAPLSQYLVWARHAVRVYGAQDLVINVVGNDFDNSLATYLKDARGFFVYVRDSTGELRLQLIESKSGAGGRITSRSALASYLVHNLQAVHHARELCASLWAAGAAAPSPKPSRYAGNTEAEAEPVRIRESLAAIDAFFRDFPIEVGLPPDRVLFTIDGFRYPQAAAAGAGTYFDHMRQAFRAKAQTLGYGAIDLDPAFFARHVWTGEYPTDEHWSPAGHGVAFEAVMTSQLIKTLSDRSK
jgi:hypothetical protein